MAGLHPSVCPSTPPPAHHADRLRHCGWRGRTGGRLSSGAEPTGLGAAVSALLSNERFLHTRGKVQSPDYRPAFVRVYHIMISLPFFRLVRTHRASASQNAEAKLSDFLSCAHAHFFTRIFLEEIYYFFSSCFHLFSLFLFVLSGCILLYHRDTAI